jgi:hypothetical protein
MDRMLAVRTGRKPQAGIGSARCACSDVETKGSSMWKTVPPPLDASTQMRPLCFSTMVLLGAKVG